MGATDGGVQVVRGEAQRVREGSKRGSWGIEFRVDLLYTVCVGEHLGR